ncbi:hypothetical protein KQH58_01065 [Mycetohabitans sp. B6]|nr:hypothetical protein [Mycetohabitans sp. B6]
MVVGSDRVLANKRFRRQPTLVRDVVPANGRRTPVYSQAIGHVHRNADLHIPDLDMLSSYCADWSLRTLLNEGLNGVPVGHPFG